MADAQYLALGIRGQVASVVGEGADVGGHRRYGGFVGQVVVILVPCRKERIALAYVYGARDAVGSMGMQGVWHTQQLLNGDEDVVVATDGVNLAFDKILSRRPINRAKIDATNLSGKQSVGIGWQNFRLGIYHTTVRTALHDGYTDTDVAVRHQSTLSVTHDSLIGHFLRSLRQRHSCRHQHSHK